jgi:hypothetical protein
LKDALAESPAPFAVIVSDWFYQEVIGWIRTPGNELPPEYP